MADVFDHSIRSYASREYGAEFNVVFVQVLDGSTKKLAEEKRLAEELNDKIRNLYALYHGNYFSSWIEFVTNIGVREALRNVVDKDLRPSILNLYRVSRARGLKRSEIESTDGVMRIQYEFGVKSKLLRTSLEEYSLDFWRSGKNESAFWDDRWKGQGDKRGFAKDFLTSPEGLSDFLALLFFKLFHLHMACVAPRSRKTNSVDWFYKPLLTVIGNCARSAESFNCYPLAPLALRIYTSLALMDLEGTGGFNGLINPRDPMLPDCLNVDVLSSMKTCVEEAKAILRDNRESLELFDVESVDNPDCLIEDIALLAWDVASSRCDPFMLGGWGNIQRLTNMSDGVQRSLLKGFDYFSSRWEDDCKSLVSKRGDTKRSRIPEPYFLDENGSGSTAEIGELRLKFLLRIKTLKRYFEVTQDLLCEGLKEYQS